MKSRAKHDLKETQMYPPLKAFLEDEGYLVRAEVEGIDVMAKKDDEVLIVEMKTGFSLKLVYQCIERLKITPNVYAYVPLEKGGRWPLAYKRMCALLKRLGCGLFTLDSRPGQMIVCHEFGPGPFKVRTNYRKRKSALKEFDGREQDLNAAGSTREPIFTVYKHKALRVARFLQENGDSSLADIAEGCGEKSVSAILQNNFHYWFERVSRGVYRTTPEFERFLSTHQDKLNTD